MHTLLGFSSVLLAAFSGYLALGGLRSLSRWSVRRDLQLFVLVAPVVSLSLVVGGLYHFADLTCFLGAPLWDHVLGGILPVALSLIALGGAGLGLVRLMLMRRVVARMGHPACPELQALADTMGERLGAPRARVLLCAYPGPLALTTGVWRPTVVLSTWLLGHLDRRELEAVLAHELGHVARRDYLVIWLATLLRDAFFYLPTSWTAYRQLQHEKELASDDLAIRLTNRPLALASALAKVWQQTVSGPAFAPAQALVERSAAIEGRIERLLANGVPVAQEPRSRFLTLALSSTALAGLLMLETANLAIMLVPMDCDLMSWIW